MKNIPVCEKSIRNLVRLPEIDVGHGPAWAPKTSERTENPELQLNQRYMELERNYLKKASAFFEKETESTH